jgi:hypothetical protein
MLVVMCSDPGIMTRNNLLQLENQSVEQVELPDLVQLGFNDHERSQILL